MLACLQLQNSQDDIYDSLTGNQTLTAIGLGALSICWPPITTVPYSAGSSCMNKKARLTIMIKAVKSSGQIVGLARLNAESRIYISLGQSRHMLRTSMLLERDTLSY